MKTFVRRLARVRHAVYGTALNGVLTALAGLYLDLMNTSNLQIDPRLLVALGVTAALVATALLVATYRVREVLEGEIVVLQQPQLPDVRAHALHMKMPSQAT